MNPPPLLLSRFDPPDDCDVAATEVPRSRLVPVTEANAEPDIALRITPDKRIEPARFASDLCSELARVLRQKLNRRPSVSQFAEEVHPLLFVLSRMVLAAHGVAFIQRDVHARQILVVEELPRPGPALLYVQSPRRLDVFGNQLDAVFHVLRVHFVTLHNRRNDTVAKRLTAELRRYVVILGHFPKREVAPMRSRLERKKLIEQKVHRTDTGFPCARWCLRDPCYWPVRHVTL